MSESRSSRTSRPRSPRDSHDVGRSRTHLVVLAMVALVLGGAFLTGYYKAPRLGLDLQGGLEIVLKASPTDGKKLTTQQLNDSVEIIRNRVDALGTTEPEIRTQGNDQIVVSLPGEQDPARAVRIVGSTAQLGFYQWEKNVVDLKAYRNAYAALDANSDRAKEAYDALPKQEAASKRQTYLFDPTKQQQAGPSTSIDQLAGQAVDRIDALQERDRPEGWDDDRKLLKDGKLPKDWTTFDVPPGERLVHGAPEDIQGQFSGISIEDAGKFDRTKGAYVLLKGKPELTGEQIKSAAAQASQGGWSTSMIFTRKGGKIFGKVTEQIARDGIRDGKPKRFAVILDDEIKSIPQIDYKRYPRGIKGNSAEISGADDRQEAADLATVLKTGALPVRFEVVSRTQVSATLGAESLSRGLKAGGLGLLAVMVYLLLFYRILGLIADLALASFALIFYGIVVGQPITMTLPGIAGAILTIGVAADANIIIFERIREEYRAGRSVPAAIKAGYSKGLRTIMDASAVTLITAFLLFIITVGSVRGFALLLMYGTLLSLLTAVAFTYALLALLGSVKAFQKPWMIGASRKEMRFHIPWMRYRSVFIGFTACIVALSLGIVVLKGLNLGVDFKSGTRFDVHLKQKATSEQIRTTLKQVDADYARATIQETKDATPGGKGADSRQFAITVERLEGGAKAATTGSKSEQEQARQNAASDEVEQALDDRFGIDADGFGTQTIGPSFGKQVMNLALIAVLVSLVLEVGYIWARFELKYALPVLVALVHDLIVAAGAYALTGREFKSTTVAALLTILGYSLYDTIIVFDRIRENVHVLRKSSFNRIVTTSLNEVLTRSLNTSLVVMLPIGMLFFFGGETLKDFAFALLVGVFVGAYSSIVVASPLLAWLKEREPAWQKRAEAEAGAGAGATAAVTDSDVGAGEAHVVEARDKTAGTAPKR